MRCQCGNELHSGDHFCPQCGMKREDVIEKDGVPISLTLDNDATQGDEGSEDSNMNSREGLDDLGVGLPPESAQNQEITPSTLMSKTTSNTLVAVKAFLSICIAVGGFFIFAYLINLLPNLDKIFITEEEAIARFGSLWTSFDNPRLYALAEMNYSPPGFIFGVIGLLFCVVPSFAIKAINGYISKRIGCKMSDVHDRSLAYGAIALAIVGYVGLIISLIRAIFQADSGHGLAASFDAVNSETLPGSLAYCAVVLPFLMLIVYYVTHRKCDNYLPIKWPMLFSGVFLPAAYLLTRIVLTFIDNPMLFLIYGIALIASFVYGGGRAVIDVTGMILSIDEKGRISDAKTGKVLTTTEDIYKGKVKLVDRDRNFK